ncbi:MAG: riboflavin synthase [Thermoplasmatota archaeon]
MMPTSAGPTPGVGHGPRDGEAYRYGVVDTTFSTIDMGAIAVATLHGQGIAPNRVLRRTVPGFKDLGVAARRLIDLDGCDVVVACGMPGPEEIDKQCAHEASQGIMLAQLLTGVHVLEVFVHMDEAEHDAELAAITQNRVAEHAVNAYWLLERPDELLRRAGTGQRQGFADVGPASGGTTGLTGGPGGGSGGAAGAH